MSQQKLSQLLDQFVAFGESCDSKIMAAVGGTNLSAGENEYLIICNYLRLHELFHSILVLTSKRLGAGAFIVLRSLSENYIHLRGCIKDPNFYHECIKRHLDKKRTRLRNLKTDLSSLDWTLTEEHREKLEQELADQIATKQGGMLPDAYQVFKRFGKVDLYHQVFSHCSLWAHNDTHTFDRYLDRNDQGTKIKENPPQELDCLLALLMTVKIIFLAYEDFVEMINAEDKLKEELARRYNELHDEIAALTKDA